jgi:hypothetical protein
MSRDDLVWWTPDTIRYGYFYGIDEGIPAVVVNTTAKRVTIRFTAKDTGMAYKRFVGRKFLKPRL